MSQGFLKGAKKFLPEVKQEVAKVTWPSRRETTMTTVFVFIFAFIAALYFICVDTIIHKLINWLIDYATH